MKAEDVFNGMNAVLIEHFLDKGGFQKGDRVRVETDDGLNEHSWEYLQHRYGEEENFIVYVTNSSGKRYMCFTRRLDPVTHAQMELFEWK